MRNAHRRSEVGLRPAKSNILLCAMYMPPKVGLFERARTFQDSLEACYKNEDFMSDGTLLPDCRQELQVLLSHQSYEEVLGSKGASGVVTPRELQLLWSIDSVPPPPAPSSGDGRYDHRMVASVPSNSHPPPGLQWGVLRGPPHPTARPRRRG